jgi:uncharacterized protein with GYD domain
MPTYIVLANWTSQGIASIKDAPGRLDAAKQAAKAAGGEIKAFYLVMGKYDFITIIEAPDDETVAKQLLAIGAQGNARTETLRAFPEDEFRSIVASMP